jgi:lysozyme
MRCLFLILLCLVPAWAADSAGVRVLAPGVSLRGVDVSRHQQDIDWAMVAASREVDFAFVKATEGGDYTDSLFCQNWEALRQFGIPRGAYHFFRAYGCGDTQAKHFLTTVEMQAGDLAPVLDVETLDGMPPEILRQEMHVWLQTVENTLGIRPIIYSNQHFFERFLAEEFGHYPLWIARYSTDAPRLAAYRSWTFWQNSNEGCIEGISRKVDTNVFEGTPEMLLEYTWKPAPTVQVLP